MSSLKDTLAPINAKVNGGRTSSALSSHGLIEIRCQSGVKELLGVIRCSRWYLWSSLNESRSFGYYRMTSRSKYSLKWNGLALQCELPSMGGTVTIGRLMMASCGIPEG